MKNISIFLILLATISACKEEVYPPLASLQPFPNSVFILLKENNQRLPDSTLNRLFLVYYEGNQKRYIRDFSRGINSFESLGIMETQELGFISANKGIKDFYLEYASGDVDTIFAEYRRATMNDNLENNCACEYPLVTLKFNGTTVQPDTSVKETRVYLFQK